MKLPEHMTILDIKENPENFDSFCYIFKNLTKKKFYLGLHKIKDIDDDGPLTDGYWNSSTSDDFKYDYQVDKDKFTYEVFAWGTLDEMRTLENRKLTEVDAKNNPNWYNKTNASSSKSITLTTDDIKEIKNFIDDIRSNDLPYGLKITPKVNIDVIMKYKRHQNREQDYVPAHKNKLQNIFDDRMGDTTGYYAVVLEDVMYQDVHYDFMKIDGNHSALACKDSKMSDYLDVIYIPKQVHEKIVKSDVHIELLASLFNKRKEQVTLSTSESDAVKTVVTMLNAGHTTRSAVVSDFLDAHMFTNSECKRIKKSANEIIRQNNSALHQTWIQYNVGQDKIDLADKLEKENQVDNVHVVAKNSKSLSYWPELRYIDLHNKNCSDDEKIKFLKVYLWHSNSASKKLHNNFKIDDENTLTNICELMNVELNIEYLPETKIL